MPAGVQPGADGTADRHREKKGETGKRGGRDRQTDRDRERERGRETYPWQCFLFMEGVLGFDGRLSGAVGEERTTCDGGRRRRNFIRVKHTLTLDIPIEHTLT